MCSDKNRHVFLEIETISPIELQVFNIFIPNDFFHEVVTKGITCTNLSIFQFDVKLLHHLPLKIMAHQDFFLWP